MAHILVVDDIAANVKLLAATLTRDDHTVDTALSGTEAFNKIGLHSPDLILLDVMMPEMDGFEVCRRLKANLQTASIPILIISTLDEAADKAAGLDAGADDFIAKPINEMALLARVRSLLQLQASRDPTRNALVYS